MAIRIVVRLYEELNDRLPLANRKRDLELELAEGATIAHTLGRLAIPVETVDLILCSGESVGLAHTPHDGDRVSIYPVFEAMDISQLTRLRGKPLRQPRFLAGHALHRLVALLAARGFDARIEDAGSDDLVRIAEQERRILLINASSSEPDRLPSRVCRVAAPEPQAQLGEVLARLDLQDPATRHESSVETPIF
jgi:hypothetical protein